MPPRLLDTNQINRALDELPGWTLGQDALVRSVQLPDFMTGIRLVDRVAEVAEEINHHPDMEIRWRTVSFSLSTHVSHGITKYDIELARRISELIDGVDDR